MSDEQGEDDEAKRRGIFGGEDPDANPLVILASYAATVIVVGLLAGAACVFVPYYLTASSSDHYHQRRDTERMMEHDSGTFAKWRFWVGVAAGSGGTMVAMVVLNSRKKG